MADVDWELMLRRALVLCDYGFSLDLIKIDKQGRHVRYNGELMKSEPFTIEWCKEWWGGEEPPDYVIKDLNELEIENYIEKRP